MQSMHNTNKQIQDTLMNDTNPLANFFIQSLERWLNWEELLYKLLYTIHIEIKSRFELEVDEREQ